MASGVMRATGLNRARLSGGFGLQSLYVLAAVAGLIGGASIAETQHVSSPTIWSAMLLGLLASAYLAITLRLQP